MEENVTHESRFPEDLLDWSGHHSGGVKRLFDSNSGRPGKELLRTNLISRLEDWSRRIASGQANTPRILLLVGGPGNGKTEAIEHTIRRIDDELVAEGRLVDLLSIAFHPLLGKPVPRSICVDASGFFPNASLFEIQIIQDASTIAGHEGRNAPELLIEELSVLLDSPPSAHYLCCVNRGVLDDALIYAIDQGLDNARILLEAITRSVSLSSSAPSCWPLENFPSIAIWPMDAESLMITPDDDSRSPAAKLLEHAVNARYWPAPGTCAAGSGCPFCHSQMLLANEGCRVSLLKMLRWYELASGKRWSFRDLFTLVSYLLAGQRPDGDGQQGSPCKWAAYMFEQDRLGQVAPIPRKHQLSAIFKIAMSGYQHALFHAWNAEASMVLRQGMKDLGMDKGSSEGRTLLGLQHFLAERKDPYLPATIATLLDDLVHLLDPALASPDHEVLVSARNKIMLADLDLRFSRSLAGGIDFIQKYKVLSSVELDLLGRLVKVDNFLSSSQTRRKSPASASRMQRLIRDFSCRLVRRSICSRSAVVADADILEEFRQVVDHDENGQRLFEVARQVKNLLNKGAGFEVSLTTTFGQPLPPRQRQATLVVPVRQVRMLPVSTAGRPRSPIAYLAVGSGKSSQPIPLTYDLFKAVKELDRGLSQASLPGAVVTLLDTTKAMLSGPIVRDLETLSDARIRIGIDGTEIGSSWNGFVASGLGETL
ncbi:ATP-binding protein [Massilia rubra]|uniref:ATP-binding protein n=1 Tax=Massilia rubra TaxID=2607910 RepID=A0ABX0LKF4_9BURK|nr:ATP-binding protein [Massilia rubra]NHZ32986.1 ATP-binding protein [Massilia rubra]